MTIPVEKFLDAIRQVLTPEPAPQPAREWMTVRDYAKRLDLHPDTIRRYIRQGMPAIRCGRGYRVSVDAADRWLRDGGAVGAATRLGRVLQ
jgi:excisionase family DNA binding protein